MTFNRDKTRLNQLLARIERELSIKLIAYDEETDDTPFGLDVIERLEEIDAAGITIPALKPPVRLTARQVARLVAIEGRFGVRIVGYCPDEVIFGEGTVRNLARIHGIGI